MENRIEVIGPHWLIYHEKQVSVISISPGNSGVEMATAVTFVNIKTFGNYIFVPLGNSSITFP